jgi:hypothetical protein
MSAPLFTPGPWEIEDDGQHNVDINGGSQDTDSRWLALAQVAVIVDDEDCPIGRANANLVVSAPRLYRELEACAGIFRAYEALHLEKGTEDGARKARVNAAYADSIEHTLAAARGEADE